LNNDDNDVVDDDFNEDNFNDDIHDEDVQAGVATSRKVL